MFENGFVDSYFGGGDKSSEVEGAFFVSSEPMFENCFACLNFGVGEKSSAVES